MSNVTTRLGRGIGHLADEDRQVATLLGLATVPITVSLSWSAVTDPSVVLGGSISGGPLALAGLIAGYYYSDRPTPARQAGMQVGLVGSLATVVVYLANTATTVGAEPGWLAGVSVLLTPVAIGIGVGLAVLVCALSAMLGNWLHTKVAGERRDGTKG